jgi:hypothetical protein
VNTALNLLVQQKGAEFLKQTEQSLASQEGYSMELIAPWP